MTKGNPTTLTMRITTKGNYMPAVALCESIMGFDKSLKALAEERGAKADELLIYGLEGTATCFSITFAFGQLRTDGKKYFDSDLEQVESEDPEVNDDEK